MSNTQRNTQIAIQRPTQTQSATGGVVNGWADVAVVWARKLSAKGREFHSAGRDLGVTDAGFQVLAQAPLQNIDQTWRIQHGTTLWNINSVDQSVAGKTITLLCKSGVNRG